MKRVWVGFVGLLLSNACDFKIDTDGLRTRAAFDFHCPSSELRITDLTPRSRFDGTGSVFGVTGCGRQATYLYTHSEERGDTWLMNSDEHRERRHKDGDEDD